MKPVVKSFVINVKLNSDFKEVVKVLSKVSFLDVVKGRDYIDAVYVESRDMKGQPYNFVLFKLEKDKITIHYTVLPTVSPSKRKLDIARYAVNILSLLVGIYNVDYKIILQLVDGVMKDLEEYASADYKKLYVMYDKLKSEHISIVKRNKQLEEKNKILAKENYELKSKYDSLLLKIKKLEYMSDDVLKDKLQEWISSHDGTIDLVEFADTYSVPYRRVEKCLDDLVSEGYLEAL